MHDVHTIVTDRFRGRTFNRRENSIGGMLWPRRLSTGSHPRRNPPSGPPPVIVSSTAGMTMLSVLNIQPVRMMTW